MKNVWGLLLLSALVLCFNLNSNAAYLKNIPQTITQPDGTIIHCFASGDEFHNWLHDANNYTILRASDGYYYYAEKSGEELIPSQYKVGKTLLKTTALVPGVNISAERIREKRRNKLQGKNNFQRFKKLKTSADTVRLNNIVLFVRFSDDAEFSTDTTTFYNLVNNKTTGYNSMYNFYQEVSYGTTFINSFLYPKPLTETTISYQDVKARGFFEPYNETSNPDGYDPDVDSIRRNREFGLLERALGYLNDSITLPSGLDLDYDNDGLVDNISFIIKGDAGGWNDLLWPHNWSLFDRIVNIGSTRVFNFNFLLETSTINRGAGVLSHEMGHAIGYPDLYHYDEESTIDPVGLWDVMATTPNPPQGFGAYLKHHVSGWIDTIPEITEAGTYTLKPVGSSDTNNVFKIASPYSTTEYFIVEYRKKEGTFESQIPESGLIVYRVNEDAVSFNGGGNADGPPDEIYVFRPNGSLTANGDLNDAALSLNSGRDSLSPQSNPAPFLQDGSAGGLYISNVGAIGETISFDVSFKPDVLHADFTANKEQTNVRDSIQFTNQSAGNPTTLNWTFEGGLPASFTGANPPPILYIDSGTFNVSLSVTSTEGTSTKLKEDFIRIIEVPGTVPPQNLSSQVEGNTVTLNWTAPSLAGIEYNLQWDDGTNSETGVGLGESTAFFDALSHWTPAQLSNFDGMSLTEISFFPFNGDANRTVRNYALRIYTGLDAATMELNQSIDSTTINLGQWNTITLTTPHIIDASGDLWFGVNHNSGTKPSGAPFGVDDGPALTNQGDVIYINASLTTLLEASGGSLNSNWNLSATVVSNEAQKSVYTLKDSQTFLKSIAGYNVYRDEVRVNSSVITETNYTDANLPIGDYEYYVTTVFSEGESIPSNRTDINVVTTVGIDDIPVEEILIYPNPVSDKLHVLLGALKNQDINVKIYDLSGKLVSAETLNSANDQLELSVQHLANGFYTLNLIGEDLIYQAKFIVSR